VKATPDLVYIPDRNCPDVYALPWWKQLLERWFGLKFERRMVAYRMGNKVFCSIRTYAKFCEAGIVESPSLAASARLKAAQELRH
jgi:hypothetical protein